MKKLTNILLFILILGISSCSSSFILRTKKKTINLISLPENSIKVGVDNGIAEIKFNRNDLIELFENDLNELFDSRIKSFVEDLKSQELDKVYKKDKTIETLPLAIYKLKFHKLLLDGKAEILLKEENKKLEKIKYEFTRSKLGQEDATFYTKDGTEFYHILVAYGE